MYTKSKAVIFDMNGVIVNDERFHQQSWVELFKQHGLHFTEDEYKKFVFGRTDYDTIRFAFGETLSHQEVNVYCDQRDVIVRRIIGDKVPVAIGVVNLIMKLHNNSIPLGLATGSRLDYANFVLDSLDIRKFFKAITTAEEVSHGKPDPEIYIKTAGKLNFSSSECTAIEDSVSGIKAAQLAEMYCVGITSTHQRNEISNADIIIESFESVNFKDLNLL